MLDVFFLLHKTDTNAVLDQVGDALVKLGVRYGGYLHGLKMFSPHQQAGTAKMFGPAYTVQMVDARDTTVARPETHFADAIYKDSVVFISQPKDYYSACWGGLMSTRAKYLGAQGVVIDGNFRDLNEHRDMNFPVRRLSHAPYVRLADYRSSSQEVLHR